MDNPSFISGWVCGMMFMLTIFAALQRLRDYLELKRLDKEWQFHKRGWDNDSIM